MKKHFGVDNNDHIFFMALGISASWSYHFMAMRWVSMMDLFITFAAIIVVSRVTFVLLGSDTDPDGPLVEMSVLSGFMSVGGITESLWVSAAACGIISTFGLTLYIKELTHDEIFSWKP